MRVFVLTSNAYTRLIPAFCDRWLKYWGRTIDVVHYDVAPDVPKIGNTFRLVQVGSQRELTWSAGLRRYLEQVSDELVVLFLDDYWLDRPVEASVVVQLEELMYTFLNFVKFDLTDDRLRFPHESMLFGRLPAVAAQPNAPFLGSYQAAIWRRHKLLSYLRDDEDAWQSERNVSDRMVREGAPVFGLANPPVSYSQATKAGKPDLLRTDRFSPTELSELAERGLLVSWGM